MFRIGTQERRYQARSGKSEMGWVNSLSRTVLEAQGRKKKNVKMYHSNYPNRISTDNPRCSNLNVFTVYGFMAYAVREHSRKSMEKY